MTAPLWAAELAAAFWAEAGEAGPSPRDLRRAVARSSFDLTVTELPGLATGRVEAYLAARGVALGGDGVNRPLRGCLVAASGCGWVFLDADDDPDEREATLAHELAHFLRHYDQPRRRAVAALGEGVLEVLDGRRPATPRERLHGLLRGVSTGRHVHLMRREPGPRFPEVEDAEREADELALELLAPGGEARARLLVNQTDDAASSPWLERLKKARRTS